MTRFEIEPETEHGITRLPPGLADEHSRLCAKPDLELDRHRQKGNQMQPLAEFLS
jgi:hypothetical protein